MARPQLGSAASRQTDLVRVADLPLLAVQSAGLVTSGGYFDTPTSGTTKLSVSSITATLYAGRTYLARVMYDGGWYGTVAADQFSLGVDIDGVAIANLGVPLYIHTANQYETPGAMEGRFTTTTGSHTFTATATRTTGTGNLQYRGRLFIYDVTPTTTLFAPSIPPAGTIEDFVGSTAPAGYLMLDGSTITGGQTLYPNLWAVIPSGWKSGANIVLPDWRRSEQSIIDGGFSNGGTTGPITGPGTSSAAASIGPLALRVGDIVEVSGSAATYTDSGGTNGMSVDLYDNGSSSGYSSQFNGLSINGLANIAIRPARFVIATAGNHTYDIRLAVTSGTTGRLLNSTLKVQVFAAHGTQNWIISTGMVTIGLQRISGLEAALPPTGSYVGQEYMATDTKRLRMWDGSIWKITSVPDSEKYVNGIVNVGSTITATTTGSYVDWVTLIASLTVPTWATKAKITFSVNYIGIITATQNVYVLRLILSNGTGIGIPKQDNAVRADVSWNEVISFTNTGAQVFKIQAVRVAGTGQWQADTSGTCFSYTIEFMQ